MIGVEVYLKILRSVLRAQIMLPVVHRKAFTYA